MRLYTSAPPRGYPYVVVKPGETHGWYAKSVIVDNGAFRYYLEGRFPDPDIWVAKLKQTAWRLSNHNTDVIIVLPDTPLSPYMTTYLARKYQRELCRDYTCMYVLHWLGDYQDHGPDYFMAQMLDIEADIYALPLKLPTNRYYSRERRATVPDITMQMAVVYDAVMAARKLNTRIHLMAPSTNLLRRLPSLLGSDIATITSFDTTAWTRAVTATAKKQLNTISARSSDERAYLLNVFIQYLRRSGIDIDTGVWSFEDMRVTLVA